MRYRQTRWAWQGNALLAAGILGDDGSVPTSSPDRKTNPTDFSVTEFIERAQPERRRLDGEALLDLFRERTGVEPLLWGESIVGFGVTHYTTTDGKTRDWPAIGFSPRKASLSLYGLTFYGSNEDLLEDLGKHKLGKGCLYINKLTDVDLAVLTELIDRAWVLNNAAEETADGA